MVRTIQIDMFEVQLGASVLLQFEAGGGTVRVLADAGVKASGYPATHVRDKLLPIMNLDRRIDLVIGTHYDEDHLNGLVPIIADNRIDIGEAWMPPIANDTQDFAVDRPFAATDLLTYQLGDSNGAEVLADYLSTKRRDIEALDLIEQNLDPEGTFGSRRVALGYDFYAEEDSLSVGFFRAQLASDRKDDHEIDHGCEQETEPDPIVLDMVNELRRGAYRYWGVGFDDSLSRLRSLAAGLRGDSEVRIRPRALTLGNLRRSAAKDAINAKALFEVVQALRRKGVSLRSEVIEDGTPKRYCWNGPKRRFVLSRPDGAGLAFDLLGPSKSLVKKHRDRLPVLEASKIALAFQGEIRSITPSNQLSYIGCFRHDDQVILISGDAGCVDFRQSQAQYYPKLLSAMVPLHVVQVAHHGGSNAHFYRVLAAAGYPEQTEQSYLLLSHATHDRKRPSDVFHDFLLTTLKEGDDVRLLFTSEPTYAKVVDYLGAINPVVGSPSRTGDIQLQYDGKWNVTAHAVSVFYFR